MVLHYHHALERHLAFMSTLPPVPCRDDLANFAQTHFNQTGRACEVGVYQGLSSERFLQSWRGEYFAIDAWDWRPQDAKSHAGMDKNYKNPATNQANYDKARERLAMHNESGRVRQIKGLSINVAHTLPDNHFDWIFIDALHTRDGMLADMRAYWPKLREGGARANS